MATKRSLARWSRRAPAVLVAIGLIGAGGWYAVSHGQSLFEREHKEKGKPAKAITVEVLTPKSGGIDRVCAQPGTLEPIEGVDLYAKVSGFLVEQNVDINSRVKAGDILARISVPEYEKQVLKDTADVARAEAKLIQTAAAITTSEAELGAATSTIALSQAEAKSKTSYQSYRLKQRDRLRDLLAQRAIDAKLVDEQEDQYAASEAATLAAEAAVNTAKEKASAAKAKVEQAKADQKYAEAEITVVKAQLDKSKVLLDYTVIRSPYTGVVTKRNFHPGKDSTAGAFIKSAEQGGTVPVLTVERTDVMRVIVQVPDRDVPFVTANATAVVEIDAIPGVKFDRNGKDKLKLARWASAQDPATRTMRVEVDVSNPVDVKHPYGILTHGMYGRVTLTLQPGETTAFRVPSGTVHRDGGKTTVRVVRLDRVHAVPVTLGTDNGVDVEILAGLTPDDRIVVRSSGPVEDGAAVTVAAAKATSTGH